MCCLKFLVEVAGRTRDVDAARNAALPVLYALDYARRLAALGTVGRLSSIHYFLAVASFCNLCHGLFGSPLGFVSAHAHRDGGGFNGAVLLLGSVSRNEAEAGLAGTSLHQARLFRPRRAQFGLVMGAGF